jgi:hypothetical protein
MLCVLTWKKYSGLPEWSYYCIYVFVLIFGAAVISARKHYTLDVVVAMYTVPLLWIAYDHKYPDKIPPEMMAEQVFNSLTELASASFIVLIFSFVLTRYLLKKWKALRVMYLQNYRVRY